MSKREGEESESIIIRERRGEVERERDRRRGVRVYSCLLSHVHSQHNTYYLVGVTYNYSIIIIYYSQVPRSPFDVSNSIYIIILSHNNLIIMNSAIISFVKYLRLVLSITSSAS